MNINAFLHQHITTDITTQTQTQTRIYTNTRRVNKNAFLHEHITTPLLQSVGEGCATEMTKTKWQRPAPPTLNPATDKIVFQQVNQH